MKPPRPKSCKAPGCTVKFTPSRPFIRHCSFDCAVIIANLALDKRARKVAKVARAELKEGRLKLKSRATWAKEAKVAIQQARRLEELAKGRGCMSCGRSQAEVQGADSWKPGGAWDGGHYLSKGAHIELALEPKAIWLQCKSCNSGSYYHAKKSRSVHEGYRANLIALEGLQLVLWLEGVHEVKHHTIDELKAIKAHFNAISAKLKKAAS